MLLVFDLDDTLYDERTFVESGFRAVATVLAPLLDVAPEILTARMAVVLDEQGRGRVFDAVLTEYGSDSPELIAQCVDVYRSHEPDIALVPNVEAMLRSLRDAGHRLYVVTDGDAPVQRRKANALGLDRYVAEVYPTWLFGADAAKPSLTCFEMIRAREQVDWEDVVYVGDDPSKDFVSLNTVGAVTVRVHSGRFAAVVAARGFDAALHVGSVTDVPSLLELHP